jgi:hypothetical protein
MPYAAFRRVPVPQQYTQNLRTTTFPAPTRGIIQSENEAYMQPGGSVVQDNWVSTMRGVKLRGGTIRWCVLPETTPVISAFEYKSGVNERMFVGNSTKLYDVTSPAGAPLAPILVKSGQTSGNYVAAHFENAAVSALGTNWLIVCNESGDYPLRTSDGISWVTLDGTIAGVASDGASRITGPAGTNVAVGRNLSYVWKYRNRLYFIEKNSMNAWYLPIDAVGGVLTKIPLAGATTKGGELLFGSVFSLDAGDGLDDKNVMATTEGEVLIFTGTNPADPANWRQEGRWVISPPLGMNAHFQSGGDLLILTVDGIVPITQAISKDIAQLELAVLTRNIKPLWRQNVNEKRLSSWTAKKWDEYGGLFISIPGGDPGNRYSLVANNVTVTEGGAAAWCRFSYDATCFIRLRGDMFFGTQGGIIMQCERSGTDDGLPYVCILVGGWETFGAPANTFVWHQSRAVFHSNQVFKPQLSAAVDYIVTLPPAPPPGPEPGILEVWDQGLWDAARWDQPSPGLAPVRNTMWVSIGKTGFAHAPVIQVTIAQQARPDVEMIATAATFEPAGVNV